MRRFVLILIFINIWFLSNAQDSRILNSNYFIEGRSHIGFIWPHHASIRYLQRGHVPAFEIKIGTSTYGLYDWAVNHNYPNIGFAFYHANLQWPDVLGNVNAVYGFMNKTLYRGDIVDISFDFQLGIAALSKHFDIEDNYYNIAIGSTYNAFFNLGFESNWKLTDKIYLINGISITHYSNGAAKKPNLGLNVPSINWGLRYIVNPVEIKSFHEKFIPASIFDASIIAAIGRKEISPDDISFLTSSIVIDAGYYASATKRFAIGLDMFYDASIIKRMEKKGLANLSTKDNLRQGVHLSFEMIYGRVSFSIQMGRYIFVNWSDNGNLYNRLVMKYRYNNYIFNIGMKTHFGRADFLEWGVGYVFWNK